VRLLLDENVSPSLARRLAAKGVNAWHTRDRGLSCAEDHVVWRRAIDEDRVVVTINARDFVKLAAREELHGGLITLPFGFGPDGQWALLGPVIDWALAEEAAGRDLLNRWVRIDGGGAWRVTDLPPAPPTG
jgi:hypothetical protein